MAGQSRIVGRVAAISYSTGLPDNIAEFLVDYRCSGPVLGQTQGQTILQCDITQNDNQINSDLRAALAAFVDPLVTPPQGYSANDVRGLNV